MKTNTNITTPVVLLILISAMTTTMAAVQNFCIADYKAQEGPMGYPCKDPKKVTVDDFVYKGLGHRRNTTGSPIKSVITTAFYDTFPGVNGLGLALARADLAPGGSVPLHSHPRGSEILILIEGTLTTGLITADNRVFTTTIKKGDVMVYPHGLLHFQVNSPESPPALFFVGFNSDNPGLQFTSYALFGNELPTELVTANTFVSEDEVKKLKAVFGGSG